MRTQYIEIAKAEHRSLYLAFLDHRAADGNVNRELLCCILKDEGFSDKRIDLLKEIYQDNKAEITWEGIRGTNVAVRKD